MARTSGIPIGVEVRERLRTAQRAEAQAIASVQKALAAEAEAGARLDDVIFRHRAELSKAARLVQVAQAAVVRTSGLDRAAALLDVSLRVLKSAVKESAHETSVQATSHNTPAATPAPTIAPTET